MRYKFVEANSIMFHSQASLHGIRYSEKLFYHNISLYLYTGIWYYKLGVVNTRLL